MHSVLTGLTQQRGKLEFVEGSARPEQHCHSEPVRTLVWESPSNFGLPIVIQPVLSAVFRCPSMRSGNRGIATEAGALVLNDPKEGAGFF